LIDVLQGGNDMRRNGKRIAIIATIIAAATAAEKSRGWKEFHKAAAAVGLAATALRIFS